MGTNDIKVWTIEQREPLGPEFVRYGLKTGTEADAIADASALLVENGGSAVEVRFRVLSTLGKVWRYIPQFIENRPEPSAIRPESDKYPEWLSPESEYTSAGADALWRRNRLFSKYRPACEFCGDTFGADSSKARYCSARCRQAAYRARRGSSESTPVSRAEAVRKGIETKRNSSAIRECGFCGDWFSIDGTQTAAIYCSARCRQAAYRARKKAEQIAGELEFLIRSTEAAGR